MDPFSRSAALVSLCTLPTNMVKFAGSATPSTPSRPTLMDRSRSQLAPFIGERRSLHAIEADHAGLPGMESLDSDQLDVLQLLPQNFTSYRRIKQDGNGGWSAIAFAYFETLLAHRSESDLLEVVSRISSLNNLIAKVGGFNESMCEEIADETIGLLRAIGNAKKSSRQSAGMQTLMERFNAPRISSAIIYHFRILASSWIQAYPEIFASYLPSAMGIEGYRKGSLENIHQGIDHLGMNIITEVLFKPSGLSLLITNLNPRESKELSSHLIQPLEKYTGVLPKESPVAFLLEILNHYHLMYTGEYSGGSARDIHVRFVSGMEEGPSEIQTNFTSLRDFCCLDDLKDLFLIPGLIADEKCASSRSVGPAHGAKTQNYSLPIYPMKYAPMRKVLMQPIESIQIEDCSLFLQTSTFRDSTYNVSHYNNPNFQPEEWSPDFDQSAFSSNRSSLSITSETVEIQPREDSIPKDTLETEDRKTVTKSPHDKHLARQPSLGLCREFHLPAQSTALSAISLMVKPKISQVSANPSLLGADELSSHMSDLQVASEFDKGESSGPQTASFNSEDGFDEIDWEESDEEESQGREFALLAHVGSLEDSIFMLEHQLYPMKNILLLNLLASSERLIKRLQTVNIDRQNQWRPAPATFKQVHPVNKSPVRIQELPSASVASSSVSQNIMEGLSLTPSAEHAPSHATEGSQQGTNTSSNSTLSFENDSLTSKSSSLRRQRRLSGGNGDFPDDGEQREPKRPRGLSPFPTASGHSSQFACPYRKHDARKYCIRNWRSCALTPHKTVARVKGHLYRHHRIFQCQRCKSQFQAQDSLDAHIESVEGCEFKPEGNVEGITSKIEKRLQSRKKTHRGQTEEERWKEIYQILFPSEPVPSAYFDPVEEETVQLSDRRSWIEYQEFSRQALPRVFRIALETAVDEEFQQIEERLRFRLVNIIQESQEQVLAEFRAQNLSSTIQDHQMQEQPLFNLASNERGD